MIGRRIVSSYTFRFLATYVAGLSIAVFLVMTLLYAIFSADYFGSVHSSVDYEMDRLAEVYQERGRDGVEQLLDNQSRVGHINKFFYLVVDEDYQKIAGNLERWPKFRQHRSGWLSFSLELLTWRGDEIGIEFIARSKTLPSGEHLLAARHYEDVIFGVKLVGGSLIWGMLVTIILGAVVGALVALSTMKRIERLNSSIQRIMSGDLSQRIPIEDSSGDFRELTANFNQMLDRIERLMVGLRQVSDNIAHDLRTPLTRLRNDLTRLQDEVESEQSQHKVQNLIEEADGLLATFAALLRIAQVESGSRRSGFTQVDLGVIAHDVVELYEPLASEKNLTLQVDIGTVDLQQGDRDLLFQALANLVDNAIKYTPEGGSIGLEMRDSVDGCRVAVWDTGCGIPASDKGYVFQRFYRVEGSRSLQPGNGLGLSLVHAVINLHHGAIELHDNLPGLRVEITLPR